MKKVALWISTLIILVFWIYILILNNKSIDNVWANPDYICTKAVVDSPCDVPNYPTSCSPWDQTTHTRICNWTKTTEVSYYLIRTTCETWYTQVARWQSGWTSWRQTSDYVSGTSLCTITEYDTIAPSWKVD